jgi:hypothetical protein
MPFSPELKIMPWIASKYLNSGLAKELIASVVRGDRSRDFIEDARRLTYEFKKDRVIVISGIENIKRGSLLAFNHPNMDTLLPGYLDLVVEVYDNIGRKVDLVMASEIMLFAKFNEKVALPGSIKFMKRLHETYGGAIISSPTVTGRKDYLTGRAIAFRKILNELKAGNIVSISPEGHVEEEDKISPPETFHQGSGAIARFISKFGIPVTPAAIWKENKNIYVKIGEQFVEQGQTNTEAVINIMKHIGFLLPKGLRGPFDNG